MLLRENPYFAILCLTAITSGCVAFMAWVRRAEAPATRPFTGLMIAIALYAGAGAMGAASISQSNTIFWAQIEAVLSSAVTALFFGFTLHFTHRRQWLTSGRRWMLWVIPIFNMALVLTNPWHSLVWNAFDALPNSNALVFHNGPAYYWLAVWFYIYVITGTLLVARSALRLERIYRQQAITVIASAVPPLFVGTLYVLELVPPGISLLPMSFLLTGGVYFTSLFRFRLFDLLPIARDTLIESMTDGVLVLDTSDRVIDMNPAAWHFAERMTATEMAMAILPLEKLLGKPVDRVLEKWPTLIQHCRQTTENEVLITMCQQPPLHINLRIRPLIDSKHRLTGKLLVIRDVTDIYQTQLMLKQTTKIQHQTQLELKRTTDLLDRRLQRIESLQAQLKEQAVRDGLTKLFNRRYFEEALMAEYAKARRHSEPLALILVDLDHFKRVNDEYGHQAGDRALQTFADIIRSHTRRSDIACRYGGEEFILAMPGMTLTEAYGRAEHIRLALRKEVIEFEGQQIQITLSGGVGALPEWGGTQDGLISLVDRALYAAKSEGRDRIYSMQLDNTAPGPLSSSNGPKAYR